MSIQPGDSMGNGRSEAPLVTYALVAVAVVIATVTLAALAAFVVINVAQQERFTGLQVLAVASLMVVGLTACGLLLAAIIINRQLGRVLERATAVDQQTAILAEQSVARTQADTYARALSVDSTEMRTLLQDIRETLLLPEAERSRRFQMLVEQEFAQRLAAVEKYIDSLDFHRAREELNALVGRFGPDERVRQAQVRLEKAAEGARANDIAQITARIQDLMGLARWTDAEQMALALAERYPGVPEGPALIERVRRERKLFEQKYRVRMHEEIQQFVHQRRWQDALRAAQQFLQTFPVGADADALRTQLGTLEANADIQARQALERQIKEYMQQQQYWDAVALARRIIAEYPLSPQANVLRSQLPRLEELARKQGPQK